MIDNLSLQTEKSLMTDSYQRIGLKVNVTNIMNLTTTATSISTSEEDGLQYI